MTAHHILIADDDADFVSALALRCRGIGLVVDTASQAMEALNRIAIRRPELAILDDDMPPGNGLAVCEMLSHSPDLKKIPVILLTGGKSQNTIQRSHELGVYYVPKCAGVWTRVEPLLRELLDLDETNDAPLEPATASANTEAEEPSSPSSKVVAQMDAVFTALGYDDEFLTPPSTETPVNSTRPWVLCIDDDTAFSFALQVRLQGRGVDMIRAFGGREGYRAAFTSPAQAIILDYELPEGNGVYVLRRLKENPVTANIPVIVLTGHADRSLERLMYSLGAACFMTKPYDWNELWHELSCLLKLSSPGSRAEVDSRAAALGTSV